MKIPQHLKHQAVVVVEDYNLIDGPNAGPETDAKGLSLGLAQWNERGKVEISAKVWRHTGERWSRQSEELPLHRVLDLALLICEAQKLMNEQALENGLNPTESTILGVLDIQLESLPVSINLENPQIEQDLQLFKNCMENDQEWILERLTKLADALKKLGI